MFLIRKRTWLTAATAIALMLALAGTHGAAAQSPVQTDTSCPSAALPADGPEQLQGQVQQLQTTFAQQLAQALNLSPATVLQAISAQTTNPASPSTLPSPPPDPIAAAAQQLGVSADQLAAGVRAADATLPCPIAPPANAGGNTSEIFIARGSGTALAGGSGSLPAGGPAIDTTAFFASIAQTLGGTFTGQQVQAAFAATAPPLPDPTQLQSMIQSRLSSFASALGVSDAALTAALQSLGASGACLPPGVIGGEVTFRAGGPATGPSYGDGPIFVPLFKTGGQAGPPPALAQLGIRPCGPVAISDNGG